MLNIKEVTILATVLATGIVVVCAIYGAASMGDDLAKLAVNRRRKKESCIEWPLCDCLSQAKCRRK